MFREDSPACECTSNASNQEVSLWPKHDTNRRTVAVRPTTVELPRALTVKELADRLRLTPVDIIKELMKNGIMATINQVIDYDTAAIVASDSGSKSRRGTGRTAAGRPREGPRNAHIVEDGRTRYHGRRS